MQNAVKAYRETQVTTTSPGQVLIMLYDGALNYLAQARERIEARDVVQKGILISKALDVINELASSLNADKGGDLAANLNQLYFFCNKRLFMANLKMDVTMIDEVAKILSGLRSAYAQIMDSPEARAASAQVEASRKTAPQASPVAVAVQATGNVMPAAVQNARRQGAYAQQSLKTAGEAGAVAAAAVDTITAPAQDAPGSALGNAQEAAPAPQAPVQAAREPETASPDVVPVLDPDEPAVHREGDGVSSSLPGFVGANKRLAASALYRKFSG